MVDTIRSNFHSKYKSSSLICPSCDEEVDSQNHVLYHCDAFSDLRTNMNPESDSDLIRFFKEVVERRIKDGNN